jgi:glycogen debranching enzyme
MRQGASPMRETSSSNGPALFQRVGKPVEIQALWLNALDAASRLERTWRQVFERGRLAFLERFWNEDLGRLADVVDVDHVLGTRDDSFRSNQILAVGGLSIALVGGTRARQVVDAVEPSSSIS